MKLCALEVDGFGRLEDREFRFAPGINVVLGPNEAGKSTLRAALVASLYGVGRKDDRDAWRPWHGGRYVTRLRYVLEDGREFEVQREFERDPKGVRVYDAAGNDVSAAAAVGKTVCPGHAHLGIPLEVFLNAACIVQGKAAIDGERADRISASLARALDGGPREDAALGAIDRLERAQREHVGSERATINAPLRNLRAEIESAHGRAESARERLRALETTRGRIREEARRAAELEAAVGEHLRRSRAFRAYALRGRLDQLRELRDDIAALQAERELVDDGAAAGPIPGRAADLAEQYRTLHALGAIAHEAAVEARTARPAPAALHELDERTREGAVDDAALAALEARARAVTEARAQSAYAGNAVHAARRSLAGGSEVAGALVTATAFVFIAAAVLAVVHLWVFVAITAVVATILGYAATTRLRARRRANATVERMQRAADEAVARERDAAAAVVAVLEPLGLSSVDELAARRTRYLELAAARDRAQRAEERARAALTRAQTAAEAFDTLAAAIVPERGATREDDVARAKALDARRDAREGIDLQLSFLRVRRDDMLGDDDEFALERELEELLAAGVVPAPLEGTPSLRAFDAERADFQRRAHLARVAAAEGTAELRTLEAQIEDVAALDEIVEDLRARAASLERFGCAVELARKTIDDRTKETHQRFARRLADYASLTFAGVTGGRYTDLRVDPGTLTLNVRVPETGAIVGVDRLSAGTREQAYLVVRLAMVRMFAEGLERAPLLFDDPFAFWDDSRIERSLPILEAVAAESQLLLFTTSRELAEAAAARGARRIDLAPASELRAGARFDALDRDERLPLLVQP